MKRRSASPPSPIGQSLAAFFVVLTVAATANAQPLRDDTTRATILFAGRAAGLHKAWKAPDGARHYAMEFNDRGRGPALRQRIVFSPGGYPLSVEIDGLSYLKTPVSERFALEWRGATWLARWQTPAESASVSIDGPRLYAPMYDISTDVMERLLLASDGKDVALLPGGIVRLERIRSVEVDSAGHRSRVTMYATHGLGLIPMVWWSDAQGRVFASEMSLNLGVSGRARGFGFMIRAGWESAAAALTTAKAAYDSTRAVTAARTLGRTPTRPVVLRNAAIVDVEAGVLRPKSMVVLAGNRIQAVGAEDQTRVPPGAEVLDLQGQTILPGLWDLHVHMADEDGVLHLAGGVTSVRDMGGEMREALARRDRITRGSLIGPRMHLAGILDGPGPFTAPTSAVVTSADSAREWVRRYADAGYDLIKIYSSIDTALVPVIVAEAHARGLRVGGHVPQGMTAEAFVRAGADELQHANFLFLNFFKDSVQDTRTPERFTAPARLAATLDLGSARVRSLVQLLRERGTRVDPTLVTFETLFNGRVGEVFPALEPVANGLPPAFRRGLLGGGLPVGPGMDQRYRASFAAFGAIVKSLYDAGVTVLPGTDVNTGFALHRELELLREAGIPAADVLRIATINAARAMRRDDLLGSIAEGKLADLVVVDGNPLARMTDIRRITLVVKDGKLFEPDVLYKSVGITSGVPRR